MEEAAKDAELGGQPIGAQTEAGKGIGGCTASHNHSAISPTVKRSAIFTKLAAMHGSIGEENEIDRKARTSLEMAMAQGTGQDGSSSEAKDACGVTPPRSGKGRTKLAARPSPHWLGGKGGNHVQENKDTQDVEGFMEVQRKGKPKGNLGSQNLSFPLSENGDHLLPKKGQNNDTTAANTKIA
ncbi:hypothetical protein K7X08_035269 [Anisodus acutangulus]|uniref:Uncharacterized protein n=1 Tax=Anisodus acutangulus TaxID=402998 RepID=A0A9Q1R2F3_9SOLA|nr:hypothetical protein K7X08_035269 [Anisodus acutangulus]